MIERNNRRILILHFDKIDKDAFFDGDIWGGEF
jgi:hypothetical protein